MKKAKRLLAVLLAAVMIMTAAYLPSYAYIAENNDYHTPTTSNVNGYYLSYGQAAGYILDMLDKLLKDANIFITCDDLNDMVGIGINIFTSNMMLNLDDYMEDAGVMDSEGEGAIMLTSVDNLIRSLYGLGDWVCNAGLASFADSLKILGDLTSESKGLGRLNGVVSLNYLRSNNDDMLVLEHLITIVAVALGPIVRDILGGEMSAGSLLEGTIDDLLKGFLGPNASLSNMGGALKDLLYTMLINSEAEEINDGVDWDPNTEGVQSLSSVDAMVQKLVDWALIDGTGTTATEGAFSMLGSGAEPLLPALGSEKLQQAGGANLGSANIMADRDLDGVAESHTMGLYQLVANVLDALLGGMLTPMLSELIVDLVGVEITEEYPMGDPEIKTDMMDNLIIGAVEDLLVANGAPDLDYANYPDSDTPVGQINALVKWFLDDGGLDALIKIDYQGIHIQDNFTSLLNDLARLAINLLPGLGLFGDSTLIYTADELNEYWAYDADMNIVNGADETAVDSLYLTFETGELVYVDTYTDNADGTKSPSIYCYYENGAVVNTTNPDAADYVNPIWIRQHYVITTQQVFACIIKMLLDDMIDGCYWPEWADSIPSLASPLLPENNYFARLDAYHEQMTARSGDIYDSNGINITPIPYTVEKTITTNGTTKTITVPQAALDIGCSYLAAYMNTQLDLNDQEKLDTDTSMEKFVGELAVWGFTNYLPMFTGQLNANGVLNAYYYSGEKTETLEKGVFMDAVNEYLAATYTNFANRTTKYEDDNHEAYDAIYTLIDKTLLKLLPTSWLPGITGSQQLILDTLLGNLIEFDLQGILGILSVNMSSDAELALPVIQVLLRVIDRVLALILNDHSVLLAVDRRPITGATYSEPSIKTLDQLLDCSSSSAALPQLIYQLLTKINTFKRPLLATLLPLLFSADYERPYDEDYLGRKGISYYKVEDLENYVKSFTDHVNATLFISLDNEEDAEAACDGNATVVRNDNGTYSIKLSNDTILSSYPDNASAKSYLELLKNAYYVAVESKTEVDEEGNPVIESYDVYWREDYKSTAFTRTTVIDDKVPYGQEYYQYTDFSYSSFYPRSARTDTVYYGNEYNTFAPEDFANAAYFYTNADQAVEKAADYASSYRSFAENDLPNAYGEWLMFSIETQLRNKDIWDENGDGKSVSSESDGEYVASSDTDPGVPVDGEPGMPGAMYPFYTTSGSTFSFFDDVNGKTISSETMASFNATNYEQIALALEYAEDERHDVALDNKQAESVIRLALYNTLGTGALQFDITLNTDGVYTGNLQWNSLTNDQLTAIANWLTANDFRYEAVLDEEGNPTGEYTILRKAFKLIDSNFSISTSNMPLPSTPPLPTDSTLVSIQQRRTLQDKSDYEKRYANFYKCYVDYITALYQNRRSLYNQIDTVSVRYEQAESARSVPMENAGDIIILDWALAYARDNYYMFDAGRNYKYTGKLVNGVPEVSKVFTAGSFGYLQEAYDYAYSLRQKIVSNAAANEVTQSMVTLAYQGILDAIRKLVEFTGFADWTQLDNYIAMAEEIVNDPNKNDPVLGYASGLDVLEEVLNDANILRARTELMHRLLLLTKQFRALCSTHCPQFFPQAALQKKQLTQSQFQTLTTVLLVTYSVFRKVPVLTTL